MAQPTTDVGARTRSVQASARTALGVRSGRRGQSWHASLRAGQAKWRRLWLGRSKAEPEPVDAGATRNPVVPEWGVA
ncbi:MAG: hypothetical protein HOP18_03725 [Deltaproteobacteria bacterium]|nr:hypothetical protein [Deltaproteobacteria bacterium]